MARNQSDLERPLVAVRCSRFRMSLKRPLAAFLNALQEPWEPAHFLIRNDGIFVALWITWNTLAPSSGQFDPRALNFTLLTLILSLQASYAAPLILLAQNRQDDRDRVKFEQDRQRSERNLADTEYLAREVAALRLAIEEVATKEFVRDEIQGVLEEILQELRQKNKNPAKKTK
jgi:uncharacterized membrane protein